MKKIILYLFYFKALQWLVITLFYTVNQTSPQPKISYLALVILLSINAVLYLIFSYLLRFKKLLIFYAALAFIFLNILLAIADKIGTLDIISIIVDISLFILLLRYKKHFLS